jgi:hypothetical protein
MLGALRVHQVRLKPALRLLERSPVAVSLTEPVTYYLALFVGEPIERLHDR